MNVDPRSRASPTKERVLEALRPDARDHVPAALHAPDPLARLGTERHLAKGQFDPVAVELRRHEVHRRRADETRHEQVRGLVVELRGRADLLQRAGPHDRDAVAQRHGLGLVVGDVDGRGAEPRLQPRHLGPHLDPQLRVEVRQRLVHQEGGGVTHDRAAHRHALALTSREVRGLAIEVLGQVEGPRGLLDLLVDLLLGAFASFSAKPMFSRTVMCG